MEEKKYFFFICKKTTDCAGYETACEEGPGVFAHVLTFLSVLLILVTLPVSLVWVVKVVQVTS